MNEPVLEIYTLLCCAETIVIFGRWRWWWLSYVGNYTTCLPTYLSIRRVSQ